MVQDQPKTDPATVARALIDVVDGMSTQGLANCTGLTLDRSAEIIAIGMAASLVHGAPDPLAPLRAAAARAAEQIPAWALVPTKLPDEPAPSSFRTACWAAVYGATVALMVQQYERDGRGCPSASDMRNIVEEAEGTADWAQTAEPCHWTRKADR